MMNICLMKHSVSANFEVNSVHHLLIRKLSQERPGEPGEIADSIVWIGINILVQYSELNLIYWKD